MKRLGAALAVVVLACSAACGSGEGGKVAAEPVTFDASGTLELLASYNGLTYQDGTCAGAGGYSDLRPGASVVVSNSDGKKVAIGELGQGESGEYEAVQCTFNFTVVDIPAGDSLYTVEVAGRGDVTFKRDDADAIKLTIGD